jgi:hemoglobin
MLIDIQTREDLYQLISIFYTQVLEDELLSVFFKEIVPIDIEQHFPTMVNFWETVLFSKASYKGNPMLKHIELSRLKRLEPIHFDRWICLWTETVQTNFQGENTRKVLQKATQIKDLMEYKVQGHGLLS